MTLRPLFFAATAFVLFWATAYGDGPVKVEINSIQETPGRITAVVSAFGADGHPVSGITPIVTAMLDGQALHVSSVQSAAASDNSAGIVLLVDVSGSMYGDPINQARTALTEFTKSLNPEDSVAIYSFEAKVHLLQDFTSNRTLLSQAITKLQATGDTALYSAVIEGVKKAVTAPNPRKLVVVLTDGGVGVSVDQDQRAASLDLARQSGVPVIAIGLGNQVDRSYLGELTDASGGRLLIAASPAALRSVYSGLTDSIKAQYTVSIAVPDSVDRSVPATLSVQVALGSDSGLAERSLAPRPGARAPTFTLDLGGLGSNRRLSGPTTLTPIVPPAITPVSVEYFVDGQSVAKVKEPPFAFTLESSQYDKGNHVIRVVATDSRGRAGEWQTAFTAVPVQTSGGGHGVPLVLPIGLVLVAGVAGVIVLLRRLRHGDSEHYESRLQPWQGRVSEPGEAPPEFQRAKRLTPAPLPDVSVLGRVIVIDEAALKTGDFGAVRDFEIGASPLTLGTSPSCKILAVDPEGRIGGEEARLWVQRGRLVYHKLTTLSAMATEGMTSGWLFLESGDEVQVGPYRVSFQAAVKPEPEYETRQPPEENARLHELWPRSAAETDRLATSPDY